MSPKTCRWLSIPTKDSSSSPAADTPASSTRWTYARREVRETQVHAALGGFHLFEADKATLDWTATKLRSFELGNLLGAHCTGIESVFELRRQLGLTRATCAVAAVGARFSLRVRARSRSNRTLSYNSRGRIRSIFGRAWLLALPESRKAFEETIRAIVESGPVPESGRGVRVFRRFNRL